MDAAFGWLGRVIEFLFSLLPRLIIVRKTHAGVRFRNGKEALPVLPGLRIYWPIVTEIVLYPTVRQTVNLDSQTLCTIDKQIIGVAGIVIYKINNTIAFLTETYDGEDTIRDIALSAIAEVVTTNSYSHLTHNRAAVHDELTETLRKALRPFGVGVNKVTLTDMFPIHLSLATWNPAEGKYSANDE